jgi:hypothetical protein
MRRHGINASQFVAKVTPAAGTTAPMNVNPFNLGTKEQNDSKNKAETSF